LKKLGLTPEKILLGGSSAFKLKMGQSAGEEYPVALILHRDNKTAKGKFANMQLRLLWPVPVDADVAQKWSSLRRFSSVFIDQAGVVNLTSDLDLKGITEETVQIFLERFEGNIILFISLVDSLRKIPEPPPQQRKEPVPDFTRALWL
jgi:hypothetical protein